jgi:hypothetical protein
MFDDLRRELIAHPCAQELHAQLAVGTTPDGWQEIDGLLLFQGKAYVPETTPLWPQLLEDAHAAGHEGIQKTMHHLRLSFIPQLGRFVRDFVKGCSVCKRNKTEHLHAARLLQPLSVPSSVWSDIAMDFVEGFPKVGGKSVILMVVDRFSKFAHFIPLGHQYSAMSVAKTFFYEIVRVHGFPCSIVSDCDLVFIGSFWKELFWLVTLLLSSTFHPQSDGQFEVTNHTIIMYLCCLAGDRFSKFAHFIPLGHQYSATSVAKAIF